MCAFRGKSRQSKQTKQRYIFHGYKSDKRVQLSFPTIVKLILIIALSCSFSFLIFHLPSEMFWGVVSLKYIGLNIVGGNWATYARPLLRSENSRLWLPTIQVRVEFWVGEITWRICHVFAPFFSATFPLLSPSSSYFLGNYAAKKSYVKFSSSCCPNCAYFRFVLQRSLQAISCKNTWQHAHNALPTLARSNPCLMRSKGLPRSIEIRCP